MMELIIQFSLQEISNSKLKEKMFQMVYLEEQLEALKEDKNQSVIFQIICQMEIMSQMFTIKDFLKINSIPMLILKDQLKEKVQ